MLNEWHLFLLTQKRIDAGEPEVSFTILSPGLWTMFSQCPARVRDDQGTRYELSAHFSTVLHEFIRVHIGAHLVHDMVEYRLYFQPDKYHPHYAPATSGLAAPPGLGEQTLGPTSPDALRALLDRLPPEAFHRLAPPAPDDDDDDDR